MSKPDPSRLPRVALIAGPTASGKSAVALTLAEEQNGTLINADASQVYAELSIITARPSEAEQARAPHRLYGYRAAADPLSAAEWAGQAARAIEEVLAEGRLPIVVGGSGLYLRTLIEGIAPVPDIAPDIRAGVRALPPGVAHAALAREDPPAAAALHPNDTGRSQRALEVVRSTGRSLLDWRDERTGGIGARYAVDARLLDPPMAALRTSIAARLRAMIAAGALEELAAWLETSPDPTLPLFRAIGVRELAAHLGEQTTLDQALAAAALSSGQYAKRQRTWFRHQFDSAATPFV